MIWSPTAKYVFDWWDSLLFFGGGGYCWAVSQKPLQPLTVTLNNQVWLWLVITSRLKICLFTPGGILSPLSTCLLLSCVKPQHTICNAASTILIWNRLTLILGWVEAGMNVHVFFYIHIFSVRILILDVWYGNGAPNYLFTKLQKGNKGTLIWNRSGFVWILIK